MGAKFWCLTASIVLIVIPLAVFALSALFALLLWAIECGPEQLSGETDVNATAAERAADALLCSYYDWFKYVCGNLVGLGNPLTPVTPESGQPLAEVLDLIISTWSLVITGTVVGLIGGLGATSLLLDRINTAIDHAQSTPKAAIEMTRPAAEEQVSASGVSPPPSPPTVPAHPQPRARRVHNILAAWAQQPVHLAVHPGRLGQVDSTGCAPPDSLDVVGGASITDTTWRPTAAQMACAIVKELGIEDASSIRQIVRAASVALGVELRDLPEGRVHQLSTIYYELFGQRLLSRGPPPHAYED